MKNHITPDIARQCLQAVINGAGQKGLDGLRETYAIALPDNLTEEDMTQWCNAVTLMSAILMLTLG